MVPHYTKDKHEEDDQRRQSAFGQRGRYRGLMVAVSARSQARGRGRGATNGRPSLLGPDFKEVFEEGGAVERRGAEGAYRGS